MGIGANGEDLGFGGSPLTVDLVDGTGGGEELGTGTGVSGTCTVGFGVGTSGLGVMPALGVVAPDCEVGMVEEGTGTLPVTTGLLVCNVVGTVVCKVVCDVLFKVGPGTGGTGPVCRRVVGTSGGLEVTYFGGIFELLGTGLGVGIKGVTGTFGVEFGDPGVAIGTIGDGTTGRGVVFGALVGAGGTTGPAVVSCSSSTVDCSSNISVVRCSVDCSVVSLNCALVINSPSAVLNKLSGTLVNEPVSVVG